MILLDTHILFWWVNEDDRLSRAALAAITAELPAGKLLISAISAWEVALLVAGGRRKLSLSVPSWLAAIERLGPVEFIPVDNAIAIDSVTLPGAFHKDPADRIIVATARKYGAPVVTADEKIRAYSHVRTIW